jgi:hypothetical protein
MVPAGPWAGGTGRDGLWRGDVDVRFYRTGAMAWLAWPSCLSTTGAGVVVNNIVQLNKECTHE